MPDYRTECTLPSQIVPGGEYIYLIEWPEGCQGQRYKAHRVILDVPSYQWKVLVEALSGPDTGLWFTCSLFNFGVRYKLAECDSAAVVI